MLEYIKKNYLTIIIVFFYTMIASLVYGIWSYSAWHLWYVTLLIVLALVAIGMTIGYFWIKSENAKKIKQEQTAIDK